MKKLIVTLILSLIFVAPAMAAPNNEPIDLVSMKESGLSNETLGRFLAQNLGSDRQAPQVDANLLTSLGRYGGDSLAVAYLDLDRATMNRPTREFGPEVVTQLMAGGMPSAELKQLLAEETARAVGQSYEAEAQPVVLAPPVPAPKVVQTMTPTVSAPTVSRPQAPEMTSRTEQALRPGQAADPASRLPVPYSTYDIRNNRQDGQVRRQNNGGSWMGVMEKELPDAHLVEVNSIGQVAQVGQEVFTRPSGHQVYRYYTGNPDNPYSGADLRQEQKNREDLQIIFSNRRAY